MARWICLVLLIVAISGAAAWLSISSSSADAPLGAATFPAAPAAAPTGPQPAVVIDTELTHPFGTMAQQSKGTHEWQVKNEGKGNLILTGTQPSCSCTVIDPKPDQEVVVKPGEAYTVRVEWATGETSGRYRKGARVLTNDLSKPQLEFLVDGNVQPPIVTMPPDGYVNVGPVSNDVEHPMLVFLGSPDRDDLEVTSVQSTRPELLQINYVPLSAEEIAKLGITAEPGKPEEQSMKLKSAYRIDVVVKPTANLGPFQEELIVQTNHPLRSEIRFMVAGRMDGPVSITPPDGLQMRSVPSARGQDGVVFLRVRGQEQTAFEVMDAPKNLKVTVAPDDDSKRTDKTRAYRMTVSVAPGTPPDVYQGTVLLKTDHPQAAEVKIPVYARVIGEN